MPGVGLELPTHYLISISTMLQGICIILILQVKKLGFREVKKPQVSGRAGTRIQSILNPKSRLFLLHHNAFEKNLEWLACKGQTNKVIHRVV